MALNRRTHPNEFGKYNAVNSAFYGNQVFAGLVLIDSRRPNENRVTDLKKGETASAPIHGSPAALENYWRAVMLFGRNVASYKFALGHSLLELSRHGKEIITLEELAEPFSRHTCHHLKIADKQGTFKSSRFLETCRKFSCPVRAR